MGGEGRGKEDRNGKREGRRRRRDKCVGKMG